MLPMVSHCLLAEGGKARVETVRQRRAGDSGWVAWRMGAMVSGGKLWGWDGDKKNGWGAWVCARSELGTYVRTYRVVAGAWRREME